MYETLSGKLQQGLVRWLSRERLLLTRLLTPVLVPGPKREMQVVL